MRKTYKDAGVDIAAAVNALKDIGELAKSTYSPNVLSTVGSFGAQFLFPAEDYDKPVLVSSTDGVGTKTLVAAEMGIYNTVGEDLLNHCVNDILTVGAKPLFMLDYIGVGKLNSSYMTELISGLVKACKETGCSLIGGEMAEMPEIYGESHYDLVGTIVGVVEKDRILEGKNIQSGDILIGLPSNGLHTNGFTLARSILFEDMSITEYNSKLDSILGEELLRVHKCYLNSIEPLLSQNLISGLAHITGGGIEGNTSRLLSDGLSLQIDWNSWQPQPIFELIQETGEVPEKEMQKTFNMGIGFVVVCSEENVDRVTELVRNSGEKPEVIGKIV
ncbi:phosphoribosylformylglycinamidine cyclo-ligase [Candidatus Marinimicrobia bacterium MT.SAG.4]|nr:phosphoribosylformylglycinamidine cyclo-ligase [Candidatus Marinimicrobia bacterium MT.SAG.4]